MPAPIQSMTTEPSVICRVCQQLINIRGREDQRVVKCANCQEGTVSLLHFVRFINNNNNNNDDDDDDVGMRQLALL